LIDADLEASNAPQSKRYQRDTNLASVLLRVCCRQCPQLYCAVPSSCDDASGYHFELSAEQLKPAADVRQYADEQTDQTEKYGDTRRAARTRTRTRVTCPSLESGGGCPVALCVWDGLTGRETPDATGGTLDAGGAGRGDYWCRVRFGREGRSWSSLGS
jgi:hypothetical protein